MSGKLDKSCALASPLSKLVLVLSVSSWDEPKRLRKQIAEVLSDEWNVVYVTLPYGLRKPAFSSDRMDEGVRVLEVAGPWLPLRWIFQYPFLRRLHARLLAKQVMHRLAGCGNPRAVFCFASQYSGLLDELGATRTIYVANDDHASMVDSAEVRARILEDEKRAVALSDGVLTVSEGIAASLAVHGKPVHVMYPGHDCRVADVNAPHRLTRSACFLGYVDWRIDFELIHRLLSAKWEVTLIGPVIGVESQVKRLKALFPNDLHGLPAMPAHDAPDVLSHYEVLIMPYQFKTPGQADVMELPNKTFVYLSALRPIVTTWMPNLKLVEPGLIYRSADYDDFLLNCERAVAEDSYEHMLYRGKLASENTWDSRKPFLYHLISGNEAALGGSS
jgi:hypothetical protein